MNPAPLSFSNRVQLLLLRLLSAVLYTTDRLLNVHWGEQVLERMARRWQTQLDELDRDLARLEQERRQIETQTEALAIHTAAIYLGGRVLAQEEMSFDPARAHEEELLDATIDLLVKHQLAAIDAQEIEPGHYVYHLEPDWAAIRARLSDAAEDAAPELAEWLHGGIEFIDDSILPALDAGR